MVKTNPLRFYFFFLQSFLRRWFKVIIGIILILIAGLIARPQLKRLRQPTLRVGLVGQYTPESLPLSVKQLISQGLTKVEDNGQIKPQLADDWQISDDEKTYTIKLKKGLEWDDGKEVTAKDIHYPYSDLNLTVVDENTIQIKLKEKFSPLLSLLSQPVFRQHLIGINNHRAKKIQRRGQTIEALTLVKSRQQPPLKIKFYASEEKLRRAFQLGEIDIIWGIKQPEKLINYPNIIAESKVSERQYTTVFFNLDKEFLEEKFFRQALAYATPKPQGNIRAKGPISRNSWAYNDFVKEYELDISHSQKLLEQNEFDQEVTIQLATLPGLLDKAEEIKESWAKINVIAEIHVVNFIPNDFEALLITQQTSVDPDQYWLWHSSQKQTNITNLANPRIDQLLEEGRQILELEERRKKYLDFQRFLLEESPAVFISYPTYYYIFRRGFEDYSLPLYNK